MILREAVIMLIIDQSMSYFCTHNEHYWTNAEYFEDDVRWKFQIHAGSMDHEFLLQKYWPASSNKIHKSTTAGTR